METTQTGASETLQQKINRLQKHAWYGDPTQRMAELHAVLADLNDLHHSLLIDVEAVIAEIERRQGDVLTAEARARHPHYGWVGVYDKLCAARDLTKGHAP
jgi:hypothetical protein